MTDVTIPILRDDVLESLRCMVVICGTAWIMYKNVVLPGSCTKMWYCLDHVQKCGTAWIMYKNLVLPGSCTKMWYCLDHVQKCGTAWIMYKNVVLPGSCSEV